MNQRQLRLEGAHNVRDLGGYVTQAGEQIRWKVFLRAANLDKLTAAGQGTLLDYGVRHIIDLRTTSELQRWPDVFAGSTALNYHHLPFFEDNPSMDDIDRLDDVVDIYKLMVERCQPAVKTILETIGAADDGAVLFHCAGGKDRTGIIAALLLGLAGVDDDTIAQDYALTAELTASLRVAWRAEAEAAGADMEKHDRMTTAKPEYMLGTLAHLHTKYGGIDGYLRAIGVDAATIGRLRSRLVTA